MWIFGYGSLLWDHWERAYGCRRTVTADLAGFRREFNKASVENWGTKQCPAPTLNLVKAADALLFTPFAPTVVIPAIYTQVSFRGRNARHWQPVAST